MSEGTTVAILTEAELQTRLAQRPGWAASGDVIVREFERPGGFMGALDFVNRLAEVAEAMDHHPDVAISWNRVTVSIGSHRLGGVTDQCLQLAAEVDRLAG